MKVLKDLGVIIILEKSHTERHYLVVECPICKSSFILRQDGLQSAISCKACVGKHLLKNKEEEAIAILASGSQECTKCHTVKVFNRVP